MPTRRLFLLSSATLAVAAGAVSCTGALTPQGPGRVGGLRPSLVVVLTVDQLGSDYLARYGDDFDSGLRRLLDEGAYWPRAAHDHAITETAPGHATILSGRHPVHTGIASNSQGVNTPEAPLLGAPGAGASPFRFKGTVLYDWMRAADPSARALSVSRKDRGAILPMGTARTDVYWYASNGTFTTSRYYREALPSWVTGFNARRGPQALAGATWDLLRPASAYPAPDSVPRESNGVDIVFPHRVPASADSAAQRMPEYPWMDSLTLDFALEGIRALQLGASARRTDLLAVSLSTTDAVGHRFGPDSREVHDQLLRLDRYLGWFLDSLFSLRGRDRIIIAVTADHGIAPYPELRSPFYANAGAQKVDQARAMAFVQRRLHEDGIDSAAVGWDDGFKVRDAAAIRRAGREPDGYAALWVREMRRVNGVARAELVADLARADTAADWIARRWLHMYAPSGDVRAVVSFTPFSYWAEVGYAHHGSVHDYDAMVPLILWGARIPAGERAGPARVIDLAPTLADLLGVRPLERLDGRPLPLAP